MRAHWRRPSARPSMVCLQAFVTQDSAVVLSAKSITVGDGLAVDGERFKKKCVAAIKFIIKAAYYKTLILIRAPSLLLLMYLRVNCRTSGGHSKYHQ